ncbi:MAG: DUF1385 domain-containing protein [Wujia sp.]
MGMVRIGGQAVIEGVMMKNDGEYAIAVRKPDKEIEVKLNKCKAASEKPKLFKMPIIRGVISFVESLVIGVKALTYSSEFYEDEETNGNSNPAPSNGGNNIKNTDGKTSNGDEMGGFAMFLTVAFSIVMAIGLFMLLPAFIVTLLDNIIKNNILLGIIEGVIRLGIFLAYVWLISLMEDIKRTYMYHGAEHKTINCLEHGEDLTVENVMKHSRFHKRCGTSFLFVVMMVSILVFMCISTRIVWLKLLLRMLLVPVIAGISYEFIRYAGRSDSKIADLLSKPGLLIQRLTTAEPTPDMVEVAIKSVEAVLDWQAYLEEERAKQEDAGLEA